MWILLVIDDTLVLYESFESDFESSSGFTENDVDEFLSSDLI